MKATIRMTLLAGFLALGGASPARADEPGEQIAVVQVEFITTALAQPDPLEEAWKYLETTTLDGPSPELLALNGLRAGKLDGGFRKEFDAVLKKMSIMRRMPQLMQMIPGQPQEFAIGSALTDRTLFIWKDTDSFIGKRFGKAQYGFLVTAQPDANQRAQVSVTPMLRYGDRLNDIMDLGFLGVSTSMQSGQSIVVMPTATPAGMGASLFQGAESLGRQRTFIVITLSAVGRAVK